MDELEAAKLHTTKVNSALEDLFEPIEYLQVRKRARLGGLLVSTWRCTSDWLTREVQLGWRGRIPIDMQVNLSVYVPDAERGAERLFDGRTIKYLTGRKKPYYLPNFFGRVVGRSSARFAKKICTDTAKSLTWFDLFASPEKCLIQLRAGETNGAGAGGGPYPWFESYFTKIVESNPPKAPKVESR